MSEKKDIPEWIKNAAQQIAHSLTDDPQSLRCSGEIFWASIHAPKFIGEIIAKHAPAYLAEDVERLVETGIKMHDLNGCDLDDPMRCDVCKNFYEALKPFQKEK